MSRRLKERAALCFLIHNNYDIIISINLINKPTELFNSYKPKKLPPKIKNLLLISLTKKVRNTTRLKLQNVNIIIVDNQMKLTINHRRQEDKQSELLKLSCRTTISRINNSNRKHK